MTTKEREPKEISLKTAKREDFDDLRPIDWIEGVGTLGTWYEVNFIKRFADVLSDIEEDIRKDERTRLMEFMSICNFDVIEIGVNMGDSTHKCERQTCCHPNEPWILCRVKTRPKSEF